MRILVAVVLLLAAFALPSASADAPPCDADVAWILRPPTFWADASCEVEGIEIFTLHVDHVFACDVTVLGHEAHCPER